MKYHHESYREFSELTTKISIITKTMLKGWETLNTRGIYDTHHINFRGFFQSLKGKSEKELNDLSRDLESRL